MPYGILYQIGASTGQHTAVSVHLKLQARVWRGDGGNGLESVTLSHPHSQGSKTLLGGEANGAKARTGPAQTAGDNLPERAGLVRVGYRTQGTGRTPSQQEGDQRRAAAGLAVARTLVIPVPRRAGARWCNRLAHWLAELGGIVGKQRITVQYSTVQ